MRLVLESDGFANAVWEEGGTHGGGVDGHGTDLGHWDWLWGHADGDVSVDRRSGSEADAWGVLR